MLLVDAVQRSSVLVVGAGGLGCPALLYLAAAGVGRLGVVDGDVVDPSNLPRQVLFDDRHVGVNKAVAASARLRRLNPQCVVEAHSTRFVPSNAESLSRGYHVLLDCSDNVATRYLCNDVAVLLGIPCVSASALRMEGQLSVYGSRMEGGPCYRCLFPLPVSSHLVTNCNEGGVLNAVTGVMGTLQALEAIKCIAQQRQAEDECLAAGEQLGEQSCHTAYRCPDLSTLSGRLLVFDGCSSTFRCVKLRGRSAQCAVCGESEWRRITLDTLRQQQYSTMCSADRTAAFDDSAISREAVLDAQSALLHVPSITVQSLASHLHDQEQCEPRLPFVVLDVRPALQFDIAHLPHSINVPRDVIQQRWTDVQQALHQAVATDEERSRAVVLASPVLSEQAQSQPSSTEDDFHTRRRCRLFVVCRRGVDSLYVTQWICAQQRHNEQQRVQSRPHSPYPHTDVMNVQGGLMAWSEHVDTHFPLY